MESDSSSSTIIDLVDGAIVGYASVAVQLQPLYKVKRVGAISGMMVAHDHRRRGIATRLLAGARDCFQRRGIRFFIVYTAAANRAAVEFYKQNGLAVLHTTFLGETEV
jgi:GNAT superfamily N-acetyltransferase